MTDPAAVTEGVAHGLARLLRVRVRVMGRARARARARARVRVRVRAGAGARARIKVRVRRAHLEPRRGRRGDPILYHPGLVRGRCRGRVTGGRGGRPARYLADLVIVVGVDCSTQRKCGESN